MELEPELLPPKSCDLDKVIAKKSRHIGAHAWLGFNVVRRVLGPKGNYTLLVNYSRSEWLTVPLLNIDRYARLADAIEESALRLNIKPDWVDRVSITGLHRATEQSKKGLVVATTLEINPSSCSDAISSSLDSADWVESGAATGLIQPQLRALVSQPKANST